MSKMLRISMDAKATVKVGPFARGGKSRVLTKAADHDFHAQSNGDASGDFPALPPMNSFSTRVTSKVTSDCLVDRLIDWWETVKERFPHITDARSSIWTMVQRTRVGAPSLCSVWWNLCSAITSRFAWRIIRPIIANTTRSNAVGAF